MKFFPCVTMMHPLVFLASSASAFTPLVVETPTLALPETATKLFAKRTSEGSGNKGISPSNSKGFGSDAAAAAAPAKTYGDTAQEPIRDMIDFDAAVADFFNTREEWWPLFRGMMTMMEGANDDDSSSSSSSCRAHEFLSSTTALSPEQDFHETSSPWKRHAPIPTRESDKEYLGAFLDSMHQSLLDIPVTMSENGAEDENDLHFVEEGRRMLAVSRFHVVNTDATEDRAAQYEQLFATCWSELMELRVRDEEHTGSLILFPAAELSDLRRFCDMNLQRPLEWLGLRGDFEVASMERGLPAIRLLYKLTDIPDVPDDESAYN